MISNMKVSLEAIKIATGQQYFSFRSPLVNSLVDFIETHPYPKKTLSLNLQIEANRIKQLAYDYYTFVQDKINKLIQIKNTATHAEQIIRTSKTGQQITSYFLSMGKEMESFNQFLQQFVIKTTNFSNEMLHILDQPPTRMVYGIGAGKNMANFNANNLALFNVSPEDILKIQGKTKENWNLRLQAGKRTLEQLSNNPNSTVSRFITNLSTLQTKNLNDVSNEVAYRYNTYKNTTNRILWSWGNGSKPGTRKWKTYLISQGSINVGNMVEAYIRCIMDKTYSSVFDGLFNFHDSQRKVLYELSIDSFLSSLNQNDNVSGALERDIFDIAAKANKAEMMSAIPLLEVAYDILSLPTINEDEIQNIIFQKFDQLHARGQIASKMSQVIDEGLTSII